MNTIAQNRNAPIHPPLFTVMALLFYGLILHKYKHSLGFRQNNCSILEVIFLFISIWLFWLFERLLYVKQSYSVCFCFFIGVVFNGYLVKLFGYFGDYAISILEVWFLGGYLVSDWVCFWGCLKLFSLRPVLPLVGLCGCLLGVWLWLAINICESVWLCLGLGFV